MQEDQVLVRPHLYNYLPALCHSKRVRATQSFIASFTIFKQSVAPFLFMEVAEATTTILNQLKNVKMLVVE